MPIVPSTSTLIEENSAVTLALYQQYIGYPPCAFFGVNNADEVQRGRCGILLKSNRDQIVTYMSEAQQELEGFLTYPLTRQFFTDEQHSFGPTQLGLRFSPWKVYPPTLAFRGRILAAGVVAIDDIALATPVDQTSDPAVIGPIATTATDVTEIRVYHPGTDVEMDPSTVTIAGGFVTITIPRCRTVLASLAENPVTGWDYTVLANFEVSADVKVVSVDASTNAVIVYPQDCGCSETLQSACMYIDNASIGSFDVKPATYAAATGWTKAAWLLCSNNIGPTAIRLNYRAGLTETTTQTRDMIIRLAHAKMPCAPCECDPAAALFRRDTTLSKIQTAESMNNPFGLRTNGAWFAYKQALLLKDVGSSVL